VHWYGTVVLKRIWRSESWPDRRELVCLNLCAHFCLKRTRGHRSSLILFVFKSARAGATYPVSRRTYSPTSLDTSNHVTVLFFPSRRPYCTGFIAFDGFTRRGRGVMKRNRSFLTIHIFACNHCTAFYIDLTCDVGDFRWRNRIRVSTRDASAQPPRKPHDR